MFGKYRTDVAIIGAGPVGMMTGLGLAWRGIDVFIADKACRTGLHSFALALHPRSLRLLDELGMADELIDAGHRVDRIHFLDGDVDRPRLTLDCSGLAGKFPFVLVVPQNLLEAMMETRLREQHVRVQWSQRARLIREKRHEIVTVLGRADRGRAAPRVLETHSKYLVGADGSHSFVRDHLRAGYREIDAMRTYAVFEFDTPMKLDSSVRIVLRDGMTSVLWPLGEHTCRWTFEIDESDRFKTNEPGGSFVLGSFVLDYLNEQIERRAPWFPRAEAPIRWSPVAQFGRRLAETFGRDRIWLVGDAAHQTSPVGVQSLNAGLFEAWDLSGRIAARLGAEGAASPLESYGERHSRHWQFLLRTDREIRSGADVDPWIAERADSIPSSVPATGKDLNLLLQQAGLHSG